MNDQLFQGKLPIMERLKRKEKMRLPDRYKPSGAGDKDVLEIEYKGGVPDRHRFQQYKNGAPLGVSVLNDKEFQELCDAIENKDSISPEEMAELTKNI